MALKYLGTEAMTSPDGTRYSCRKYLVCEGRLLFIDSRIFHFSKDPDAMLQKEVDRVLALNANDE